MVVVVVLAMTAVVVIVKNLDPPRSDVTIKKIQVSQHKEY